MVTDGRGARYWCHLRDMGARSRSHSRPAMAGGIYSANLRRCAVDGLDSSRHGGTGMTGVSKGIPSQMTPTAGGSPRFVYQAETIYNKRNQLGCWRRHETRTVTVEANGSGIRIRPVFLSAGGGATSSNCPCAHHATCGHGEARHTAREHPPAGAPRI
jgi:hypothetical protein